MWWHALWEAEVPVVDPNSSLRKKPVWGATIPGLRPIECDDTVLERRRTALRTSRYGDGGPRSAAAALSAGNRTPQSQKSDRSPARSRCRSADRVRGGKQVPVPQGAVQKRPRSAVALLRGNSTSGSGLCQKTHEDEFLQGMENGEVQREVDGLRAKALQQKDFVDSFDVLQDTYLFDLKVLHNMDARRKKPVPNEMSQSGAHRTVEKPTRGKQKQFAGWEDLNTGERLKKLRTILDTSVRSATRVSSRPSPQSQDPTADGSIEAPAWSRGRGAVPEDKGHVDAPKSPQTSSPARQLLQRKGTKKTLKNGGDSSYASIFNLTLQMPEPKSVIDEDDKKKRAATDSSGQSLGGAEAAQIVPHRKEVIELIDFLLNNFGSFEYAWERIDMHKTGRLSCLQWTKNLHKLGFAGDTRKTFAYLADAADVVGGDTREISIKDFERFDPVVEMYLRDIENKQAVMEARVDKIHLTPTMPAAQYASLSASRLAEPELKLVKDDEEQRNSQLRRQRKAAMPSLLSTGDRVRGALTVAESKQRQDEINERNKMKQMAVQQDFQVIFQKWHAKAFLQYEDEMQQVDRQVAAVQRSQIAGSLLSPRTGPTPQRTRTGLAATYAIGKD